MTGFMFLLPSIICFCVFLLYPICFGFLLSFTSNRSAGSVMQFNGIQNYIRLFTTDSYFRISLANNLLYALLYTPGVLLLGLMTALLLNQEIRGRRLMRTICFFPYLTSLVTVATVWNMIFAPGGPVNGILSALGVQNLPGWLMDKHWALLSVVIVAIWKNYGYYMIILLAGLQGIPAYLYESARIDGAGKWKLFWKITFPMLTPSLFLSLITVIIASFQEFTLVKIMTDGGPGRATSVLSLRIYIEGFVNMKMGYASSIAYTLFAIITVATILQFIGQKKWVNYDV